jgi:hypothetical protein
MAFLLPFFENDVFVSYSHAASGFDSPLRDWTHDLIRDLVSEIHDVDPKFDELRIFYEEKIDPTVHLTDQVRANLSSSGILLVVMSPRFLASSWCMDEINWFQKQVAARERERGRVLIIRALPTDETMWPDFLRDQQGHALLGSRFYDPQNGMPYGWRGNRETHELYRRQLGQLRTVLIKTLREMRDKLEHVSPRPPQTSLVARRIYLHARPAYSTLRDEISVQLKREGMIPLFETNGGAGLRVGTSESRARSEVLKRCDALALVRGNDDESFIADLFEIGVGERERVKREGGGPLPCAVLDNSGEPLLFNMSGYGIERFDLKTADWSGKFRGWIEGNAGAPASQPIADPSIGRKIEENSKVKVFICHSRKDMAFVDRLVAALDARGIELFMDRSDINAFEERWKRIEVLISRADTIVCVLSPDSVESSTFLHEVALAASLNKRFVPIVYRPVGSVPETLAKINFISFEDAARFETHAGQLVEALNTDRSWIRQHTEFGEQARRWALGNKSAGLLLRPPVLQEAERWIASRPQGAPEPTDQILEYISQSRQAGGVADRPRRILRPLGPVARRFQEIDRLASLLARACEGPAGRLRAAGTRLVARLSAVFIRPAARNLPLFLTAASGAAAVVLVLAPVLAAWATASVLTRGSHLLVDPSLGDTLHAHKTETTAIVLSSRTQAATSSYDGTIKFWDLGSGRLVRTVTAPAAPSAAAAALLSFAFDMGRKIIAITESGPAFEDANGNLQLDQSSDNLSLATPSGFVSPLGPQVANAIATPYATARNWYTRGSATEQQQQQHRFCLRD